MSHPLRALSLSLRAALSPPLRALSLSKGKVAVLRQAQDTILLING